MEAYILFDKKVILQMNETKLKYGIWGGRFQIIHKGHEHVLHYVAKNYSHVCIGIVNPDPNTPAWSVAEHEKFDPQKNPFTYFQRAYLWNKLIKHYNIEAVIVPHWHPRKSLNIEFTFLPQPKKSREWIIPFIGDEEYKIKDFRDAGENVFELREESNDLKVIHASEIRRLFDNRDTSYKIDIPKILQSKTEEFLMKKEFCEQFIVIPILNDNLNPLLICGAIQLSFQYNKNLIFAPVVNVQNKEEWWKFKPIDDYFTFYEKHEMINCIMKSLNFHDYMVLPIIMKEHRCQLINTFLPDSDSRSWGFIKGINTDSGFKQFLREEIIEISTENIDNEIYIEVYSSLFDLYNRKHYYDDLFNDDEKNSEEKNMSKNDFSHANIGIINMPEGDINLNNQTANNIDPINKESIIADILTSKNEVEFKASVIKADAIFQNTSKIEIKKIIENIVNEQIDSEEKKTSFLKKFKVSALDISKSIIAGLLLQAIKNVVFIP